MKKVIKDGKVAVLYSPGYGAGWTTWGAPKEMLYDPQVVELVESNRHSEIRNALLERGYDFYMGSNVEDLRVEWISEGIDFKISEYDGNESIEFKEETDWETA